MKRIERLLRPVRPRAVRGSALAAGALAVCCAAAVFAWQPAPKAAVSASGEVAAQPQAKAPAAIPAPPPPSEIKVEPLTLAAPASPKEVETPQIAPPPPPLIRDGKTAQAAPPPPPPAKGPVAQTAPLPPPPPPPARAKGTQGAPLPPPPPPSAKHQVAQALTEAQERELQAFKQVYPAGQPTPYAKWVNEDVAYTITPEEKQAFALLTSDPERERFIEQFWLRRDPTPGTVENEFKQEHYRRIAYANEHFADRSPGWTSDRGRIYITLGPPDLIDDHSNAIQPSQVWTYRVHPGSLYRVFSFHDTGDGILRLVSNQEDRTAPRQ